MAFKAVLLRQRATKESGDGRSHLQMLTTGRMTRNILDWKPERAF